MYKYMEKTTFCTIAQRNAFSFFRYPGGAICHQNMLPSKVVCYWHLRATGKCCYWSTSVAAVHPSQTSLLVQSSELTAGALLGNAFANWELQVQRRTRFI